MVTDLALMTKSVSAPMSNLALVSLNWMSGEASVVHTMTPAPGCPANGDAVNVGNFNEYINLSCFRMPPAGELGNVGRNTLRGPGFEDFDFSIFKNTTVRGERQIQFRAEFFNVLNRPNFEFRLAQILDSNGNLVPINAIPQAPTVNAARQIQFGLKFTY